MSNMPPPPAHLLTPDEVCAWLRIERRPLYRLIARGAIPHIKLGNRLRFDHGAIVAWLDHHRREHDPQPTHNTRIPARARPSPPPNPPSPHLIAFDRLLAIEAGAR